MIDRSHIGKRWPAYTVEVEKGRLRMFANAIGERNPVYTDEAAAAEAGYPGLPIPPTILFAFQAEGSSSIALLAEMGIDIGKVLHVEQSFVYHRAAFAGETLRFESWFSDIYQKKGGAVEFIVRETAVTSWGGRPVADLRTVIMIRNG